MSRKSYCTSVDVEIDAEDLAEFLRDVGYTIIPPGEIPEPVQYDKAWAWETLRKLASEYSGEIHEDSFTVTLVLHRAL